MSVLENNFLRRIIRLIFAFIVALLANYFFSKTMSYWLPIATLFVMLTRIGNALFQGVIRFFILVILIVMISVLFGSGFAWKAILYDITLGAMIGILMNVTVFPDRVNVAFRNSMIPILKSYKEYFGSIVDLLLQINLKKAELAKEKLEKQLNKMPDWVLEVGFDKRLQKGHRYFLIKSEQMCELLYAMHHLARYPFEKQKILKLRKPLLQCVKKVNHFFNALTTVMDLKKLTEGVDDFAFEIKKIEKTFKKSIPLSTDLLDIEKDYVYLIEFIYHLNDLHDAMVKLASALR